MEMTDDSLNSRLKGIADEIKTDDMSIIKKPMISLNDDDLKPTEYSKRIGTPFKQQKLPAWQPILTASTVIPWLLAIGVIFIPIGALLLNTSNRIQEFKYDYTDCTNESKTKTKCADIVANYTLAKTTKCTCSIKFELPEAIDRDAYLYYALTNFFQNHRRYVRSRNDWQLNGDTSLESLSSCAPFDKAFDVKENKDMLVAPCGAIANSIFNDTFQLYYEVANETDKKDPEKVELLEDAISWPTDRAYKFRNPPDLKELADKFTHPVNWPIYLQNFTSGNSTAFENEHLIVWMRSSALPNFRKLWARVDHRSKEFQLGLPKGTYKMVIEYNFPVTQFNGEKWFILSNTSWLGGKNPFLGIAYIITGSLCILITGILFVIYQKFGVRERDMTVVDNNTPFIYSNLDQDR